MADYELAGRVLETPLLNAAGSVNGTSQELIQRDVATLARSPIGAIVFGSLTVHKQADNEVRFGAPAYHHDSDTGATYNSMGLPNIGLDNALRLMPDLVARAHERGKPLVVSVSPTLPNPEVGDTLEQTARLVGELMTTRADLIEVNTSCPNIVNESGDRKPVLGYDLDSMATLVSRLEHIAGMKATRLGVKLPPYLTHEERSIIPELAQLFAEHPVFAYIATANTIPNQVARDKIGQPILRVPDGAGGLSGPITREVGREQLQLWHEATGGTIDIVSSLGVDSGREMAKRRDLGAAAVSGVTFLWESNDWGKAVTDMITEWLEYETEAVADAP